MRLNRSVSIPVRCVRIRYKIQMNKPADISINQGRPESRLNCANYRKENCSLLNPLGYKGAKLDFENLALRDTVRKQLLILTSSVSGFQREASDRAVFILGRSVSCFAANVLNMLQGKLVLSGVGDMTQMISSE